MKRSVSLASLAFLSVPLGIACQGPAIEEPISGSPSDGSPGASSSAPSSSEVPDAALDHGASPSPPGGEPAFAYVVNGAVQTPLSCPSARWEFPAPGHDGGQACGNSCLMGCGSDPNSCPGITSVLIRNTGSIPIAYIASDLWSTFSAYVPGAPTGDVNQLAGVLDPGAQVDITAVYDSALVAILGSSASFSPPDASYAGDEGTIPWPAGVSGGNGSSQMWIAEIEEVAGCTVPDHAW
jgi:hypothetical protein